ncbi:MAG: aspartate-semialdehyde dehydrogenase [Acidobacteria bacterium]|nr:aspartate-semialdehyde dehydrogenase [Acidobacteriota bacterium]MBV9474437.1 aspartate-semialdehyde dehydrogenase [Acidobacteriota bacterium]
MTASERIPVAILGATGSVGQRFIQLLADHPWFRVAEVVASDRSAGKTYGEAAGWRLETLLPDDIAAMTVKNLGADLTSRLVFSGLDSSVAGDAEDDYANRGCAVISNARNHRMDADVPLLIPEVNASHVDAIATQQQRFRNHGYIVTNPNCSVMGLAIALAPLEKEFGVEAVHTTTMQAISGAGYAGVASYAILDNVIPYIGGGEEDKIEAEPRKILGSWTNGRFEDAPLKISAQVNRVPVIDGHLMTASVKLRGRAPLDDVRRCLESFTGEPQRLGLPSAPRHPIHYIDAQDRPQPRLDRDREGGMAVSVGRLRACPLLDFRMVVLVHNTIRGAAGAAILNAELLHSRGLLP